MCESDGDKEIARQVALAEFSALRAEINNRSNAAQTLLNLNLTASATIAGFVMSDKADPLVLLLLPILSPALGMLFIDHAYNIINIGEYINTEIRTVVNLDHQNRSLLAYEERVDRYEQNKFFRFLPLGVPVVVMFCLAPIAALVFLLSRLQTLWSWLLWWSGLILILMWLLLWIYFLMKPYLQKRSDLPPS